VLECDFVQVPKLRLEQEEESTLCTRSIIKYIGSWKSEPDLHFVHHRACDNDTPFLVPSPRRATFGDRNAVPDGATVTSVHWAIDDMVLAADKNTAGAIERVGICGLTTRNLDEQVGAGVGRLGVFSHDVVQAEIEFIEGEHLVSRLREQARDR
jgi:hypothetical protein